MSNESGPPGEAGRSGGQAGKQTRGRGVDIAGGRGDGGVVAAASSLAFGRPWGKVAAAGVAGRRSSRHAPLLQRRCRACHSCADFARIIRKRRLERELSFRENVRSEKPRSHRARAPCNFFPDALEKTAAQRCSLEKRT